MSSQLCLLTGAGGVFCESKGTSVMVGVHGLTDGEHCWAVERCSSASAGMELVYAIIYVSRSMYIIYNNMPRTDTQRLHRNGCISEHSIFLASAS